jgi:hypothetical protein
VQYNTTFGNIKKADSNKYMLHKGNKVRIYSSEQKNRYSAQTNCMSW